MSHTPGRVISLLDRLPTNRPERVGTCPACAEPVFADGHCILLHNAFFHTGCAVYRPGSVRRASAARHARPESAA